MKQLSCGIIILNREHKILGCLPTGNKADRPNQFDIPKGKIEEGETPKEAAIRECFEETGLDLGKETLYELGVFPYLKSKNLHLFCCIDYDIMDLTNLKCSTYFTTKNGVDLPEIKGYELIGFSDIDQKFFYNLAPILKKVLINN